jgi:hypothetical protein
MDKIMYNPINIYEEEYLTDMDLARMEDDEDSWNPDELNNEEE